MDNHSNIPEKVTLIALSALLLAGALILHARHTHPVHEISVERNGLEKYVSLKNIAGHLDEIKKVNINEATAEELESIPGIGPAMASRLIKYRNEHGLFACESSLLDVKGLGEKKVAKMRDWIRF